MVGAGWAGLSAAVELSERGMPVTLLEAAPVAGGRARSVRHSGRTLDNGQHLLLGAYRDTRALLRRIGVREADVFARMPLELRLHDPQDGDLHLRAGALPGRLHLAQALLGARGLALGERWRWLRAADQLRRQPPPDLTVSAWLAATGQPRRMRRQLWEPLCLAALNTPADTASASVFHRVLDEALASPEHSALYIPSRALGRVLPEPAEGYLRTRGASLRYGARAKSLTIRDGRIAGVTLRNGESIEADTVVLACGPRESTRLLTPHAETAEIADRLGRLEMQPIVTLYLDYGPATRLDPTMQGLLDGPLQWVFDRGQGGEPGLIAGVISGPGEHMNLDNETLVRTAARQLGRLLADPDQYRSAWVVRERLATFAATPAAEALRPAPQTPVRGLWLAGDHLDTGLPATLEGAVRSGLDCAQRLAAADRTAELPEPGAAR